MVVHALSLLADASGPEGRNRRSAANALHLVRAVLMHASQHATLLSLQTLHDLFAMPSSLPMPQDFMQNGTLACRGVCIGRVVYVALYKGAL
jgi:hypothetical protein